MTKWIVAIVGAFLAGVVVALLGGEGLLLLDENLQPAVIGLVAGLGGAIVGAGASLTATAYSAKAQREQEQRVWLREKLYELLEEMDDKREPIADSLISPSGVKDVKNRLLRYNLRLWQIQGRLCTLCYLIHSETEADRICDGLDEACERCNKAVNACKSMDGAQLAVDMTKAFEEVLRSMVMKGLDACRK